MRKLILKGIATEHWTGVAGRRFRQGISAICSFIYRFLRATNLEPESIGKLASAKLIGVSTKELAEVAKAFNEAELTKLNISLSERILESKVKQAESEAHIAEINSLDAELELLLKLKQAGLTLERVDSRLCIRPVNEQSQPLPERRSKAGSDQSSSQSA